jgi:uncharacterized repeat protein (TIGR03803 family)
MTRRFPFSSSLIAVVFLAALFAVLMFAGATFAAAQTESVIHAFQSTSKTDGNGPYGLVADNKGNLYGVTYGGGRYAWGTVYKLTPPAKQGGAWTQSVLYSFTGAADGGGPTGNLYLDPKNNIHGTTTHGGIGSGVVFELSPGKPWTETVLHNFVGGKDGIYPNGGLISDGHGTLYGTTSGGGSDEYGIVFRLSPPTKSGDAWTEATLYAFQGGGTDALGPVAGMVRDASGALYGTTEDGGENNLGAVFKLTPPSGGKGSWSESVLYSFTGYTDGQYPVASLIFDGNGALYGTTVSGGVGAGQCGCGTIFQLTPPDGGSGPWTENTLYTFNGSGDGANPTDNLIFDSTGALYGTASLGGNTALSCFIGVNNGCGIAFKLNPPSTQGGTWAQSVLHTFQDGSDGAYPIAPLVQVGTTFYGTTYEGGQRGLGTVFEIAP